MKKSNGAVISTSKTGQNADRKQSGRYHPESIRTSVEPAGYQLRGYIGSHAGFLEGGTQQSGTGQRNKKTEDRIQELKKQSHMLSKILTEGNMDSAIFIEKRNQIDMELEHLWRKLR